MPSSSLPDLRALLARCQEEEVHHRDEARGLGGGAPGPLLRGWAWVVGSGSAGGGGGERAGVGRQGPPLPPPGPTPPRGSRPLGTPFCLTPKAEGAKSPLRLRR